MEQHLGPGVEPSSSVPGLSLWMPEPSFELRRLASAVLSPADLEGFLANPVTRTFEQSPAGLHEVLVALSLGEAAAGFEVVVLDTPPREQAMSFFATPGRLARLLEGRAVALFSRFGRGRGLGQAALERVLGGIVPPEVVADGAEFFRLLLGARAELNARAEAARALLAGAEHVVVVSPTQASIHGATLLRKALARDGTRVHAILNGAVREAGSAKPNAVEVARRFPNGWRFPRVDGPSRGVVEALSGRVPLFAAAGER